MGNKDSQQILVQVLSDIETCNEAKPQKLKDHDTNCINKVYLAKNNLYIGLYALHLTNWLCNFPSENILLNSKKFCKLPAEIL